MPDNDQALDEAKAADVIHLIAGTFQNVATTPLPNETALYLACIAFQAVKVHIAQANEVHPELLAAFNGRKKGSN